MDLLAELPAESMQLIVTSPPYNIGKSYEKRSPLESYLEFQKATITACVKALKPQGSICWQVGNFVDKRGIGSIVPLDIAIFSIFAELGLKLRNRIIWHFEHGLHCSNRFSGRYETILWFTKTDDYVFNLDPIRVPQKYPGKKYFKGPKGVRFYVFQSSVELSRAAWRLTHPAGCPVSGYRPGPLAIISTYGQIPHRPPSR